MATMNWTTKNIPSQKGKTILITGANSGLGFEASRVLSKRGAHIIMAVRNMQKGKAAEKIIKKENPDAKLEIMKLNLADFDSIRRFSDEFHSRYSQLHVLIDNAGIMAPAKRDLTKQGFEAQFGINHLGHFLLTGLLLDILKETPGSRISVQSSIAHKVAVCNPDIHFEDLNFDKNYNRNHAYGQSKLANLLFAYELDRKLKAHKIQTIVTAAHPGYTSTNLQKNYGFMVSFFINKLIAMPLHKGVLPILRAATEEGLKGSEFFGPTKLKEIKGYPELVKSSEKSYDKDLAKKLWEVSEKLTDFNYNFDE